MIRLQTPLTQEKIAGLKAGDQVLLSGVIYTARDAAHKRLFQLLAQGEDLPFPLADQVIYYVGPTPAKPGMIFGSGGPTTSGRMDKFAPRLIGLGLRSMIGKGYRSQEVKTAIVQNKGVYFGAVGGSAVVIADTVKKCDVIAFADLGPEAIRRLEVVDLPLVVVIDSQGNDLYEVGREMYLKERS